MICVKPIILRKQKQKQFSNLFILRFTNKRENKNTEMIPFRDKNIESIDKTISTHNKTSNQSSSTTTTHLYY